MPSAKTEQDARGVPKRAGQTKHVLWVTQCTHCTSMPAHPWRTSVPETWSPGAPHAGADFTTAFGAAQRGAVAASEDFRRASGPPGGAVSSAVSSPGGSLERAAEVPPPRPALCDPWLGEVCPLQSAVTQASGSSSHMSIQQKPKQRVCTAFLQGEHAAAPAAGQPAAAAAAGTAAGPHGSDAVWRGLGGDAGAAAASPAAAGADPTISSGREAAADAGAGASSPAAAAAGSPRPGSGAPGALAASAGGTPDGAAPSREASADAEHSGVSAAERETMYRMYSHHVEVGRSAPAAGSTAWSECTPVNIWTANGGCPSC